LREVTRIINVVKRRIYWNRFLRHGLRALFWGVVGLSFPVLFVKLVFFPDALWYLAWTALACLVVAAVYACVLSRSEALSAAMAADERLNFAERLSSALLLSSVKSPMAMAVVEDARERARSADLSGRFPLSLPDDWWHSAAAAAVLAVLLVLPQFDLFGRREAWHRRQREREEVAEEVAKAVKKLDRLKKSTPAEDLETMELIETLRAELQDIEDRGLGKKEALAELSEALKALSERMKEVARTAQKTSPEASQAFSGEAQREALKKAAAQMAKMQKALEAGDLDEKEAGELAKAIEKMAAELAKRAAQAAEEIKKMQQQLEKGGLSASEAAKLAGAIRRLQQQMGLNSQTAQAMNNIANQLAAGNLQRAASLMQSAMAGMEGALAGADAAAQIAAMAEAMEGLEGFKAGLTGESAISMQEALAALGMMAGSGRCRGGGVGPGMGGHGIGEGNVWDVSDVATDTQTSSIKGQMKKGKVLAAFFTEGGQLKNESRVEYQDVVASGEQEAKGALGTPGIPRAYRETVRNYFENLRTAGQDE